MIQVFRHTLCFNIIQHIWINFQELYEKTAVYEDMVECHKRELAAKQEEMDQEVEACNRVYQTRLAEQEAAQEAKWLDMVCTFSQLIFCH